MFWTVYFLTKKNGTSILFLKLWVLLLPHLVCPVSAIWVCRGCFFLLTYSFAFHYVCVIFEILLNTSLYATAFGSLRPEKCPQVYTNSSGKPSIEPPQEQQQGQDSLPPTGQDEITSTACTAQVAEDDNNEVHIGQASKLQEVAEENKMGTLSSKDEHLQT